MPEVLSSTRGSVYRCCQNLLPISNRPLRKLGTWAEEGRVCAPEYDLIYITNVRGTKA